MSSPPEYQSLAQRDSSEHDSKLRQHVYPPAITSNGESSAAAAGVATVTYTFEPRWPIAGKTEDALGVLYPNREATVQAVQRMFPLLDEYDSDRVDILALVHVDSGQPRWGVIMEDAWPHITATGSTPKQLKVQIKDLPGVARRRHRREVLKICAIMLSAVFGPILFFGGIIAIGSFMSDD